MSDYHINIFASDEDGGHIADVPDLTHCSAFGTGGWESERSGTDGGHEHSKPNQKTWR